MAHLTLLQWLLHPAILVAVAGLVVVYHKEDSFHTVHMALPLVEIQAAHNSLGSYQTTLEAQGVQEVQDEVHC